MALSRAKTHSRRRLVAPLISLSFVLIFALLAISPAVQPVKADSPDWDGIATVATNAAGGAAIGTIIGDGIGTPIGLAVGAFVGFLEAWYSSNNLNPLIAEKQIYASNLANLTYDCLAYAHYNAQTDKQLENAIQFYIARQAEYGAKQLYDLQAAAHTAHVYNAAYVLQDSQIASSTTAYLWNIIEAYNGALQLLDGTTQGYVGDYAGMGFGYFGGVINLSPGYLMDVSSSAIIGGRMTCAINTTTGKYVDLNTRSPIYIQGAGTSGVLNLTSLADGTTHQFTYDSGFSIINASLLLPGIYHLATNHAVSLICGLATLAPQNSGTVYPALAVYNMNETSSPEWQFTQVYTGTNEIQYWPGHSYSIGRIADYDAKVVFATSTSVTDSNMYTTPASIFPISLYNAYADMALAISDAATMVTTANSYGQSFFNTLVLTGGQGVAPMPDFAFPDPGQLNMSDSQLYAIYIAYMRQAASWYENYSSLLPENVNISAQSINLICRGPIYNATGAQVYNATTIWTPYVSIQDDSLTVGENTTFDQPGFIMVWGHGATINQTLEGHWYDQSMTYQAFTLNWTVHPLEMNYNGHFVSHQYLNITTIHQIVLDNLKTITAPQSESDWAWILAHWYLFALIAGAVVLLGAAATKNWIIAIVGLILIGAGVVGWFFAGGLTSFGPLLNVGYSMGIGLG